MGKARNTVIGAVALVATLAVATPAFAGRAPATAKATAHAIGSPSQIPWDSVGSGWVLTEWFRSSKVPAAAYLVLTSEAGQRYFVMKVRAPLVKATLLDWSGNGQSALFDTETNAGITTIYVVDLRTGSIQDRFVLPANSTANFQTAGFTRPDGYGVIVDIYAQQPALSRYSLSGHLQATYPSSFPVVGKLTGAWLYRPDGTELALGASRGLAVVDNDGTAVAQVRLAGSSFCQPKAWWSPTVILASCAVGPHSEARLFEFDVASGTARALTRVNSGTDDGDLAGWRVDGHVYVEVASACGYVYLAKLVGAAPIMVNVPGVAAGKSEYVIGATHSALALTVQVACHGGPSLLWYTPSSNTSRVVLGPPATGGIPGPSFAYPPSYG